MKHFAVVGPMLEKYLPEPERSMMPESKRKWAVNGKYIISNCIGYIFEELYGHNMRPLYKEAFSLIIC